MKRYFSKWFDQLKTTKNHWVRKTVGVLLLVGGIFGFLPVLGYWMLPLGLTLLAVDWPFARRVYRRLIVWWGRRLQQFGCKPRRPHDKHSGL